MDSNIIIPTSRRFSSRLKGFNCRFAYFSTTLPLVATCLLLASILLVPVGPAAAQADPGKIEDIARDPKIPWQLEADQVEYDQTINEYTATGNVLIYKENIRMSADFVRFDHKNMKAYAEGNVVLTDGSDVLKGDRMEIDLDQQIGSIDNGYLFLKENNYHITGDVIKKVGVGGSYIAEDHTVLHARETYWKSDLFNQASWEAWNTKGGKDVHEMAHEKVEKILGKHYPPEILISPEAVEKIDAIIQDAKQHPERFEE